MNEAIVKQNKEREKKMRITMIKNDNNIYDNNISNINNKLE